MTPMEQLKAMVAGKKVAFIGAGVILSAKVSK